MPARFQPRLTYANVVATLALILAMGGGAYAAISSIPGPDGVIHGCYQKKKGNLRLVPTSKKCSKSERKIAFNQQGPSGPAGQNGAPGTAGAPGSPGAPGTARAYAHVSPGASPSFDTTRTMGFTAVSNVGIGTYCLTPVAGVDPSKYPAVAVGEWSNSGNAMPYVAMVDNLGLACSTGEYEILAGHGTASLADDVAFNVIVP